MASAICGVAPAVTPIGTKVDEKSANTAPRF
jgi:hypothetical protein